MRKILILLTALTLCGAVNASAQEDAQFKKWEHNFYFSTGLLIDCYGGNQSFLWDEWKRDKGVTVKAGYGLNHYFSEKYSLMLGAAIRGDLALELEDEGEHSDGDMLGFLDIPLIFQYHFGKNNANGNWMVGFGPIVSVRTYKDTYQDYGGRWIPDHPLMDYEKIKSTYVSLMPCVAYETKHLRMGIDASIGLSNVNIYYPGHDTGSKYLHNICATFGVKF